MRTNRDLKLGNLPRCDWRTFLKYTGTDPIPYEMVEQLDHYFKHFVPEGPCIKCGTSVGESAPFEFGIQFGEGRCPMGGCYWPARAIHLNVGPFKELQMVLQYHPDVVTWDE